MPPWNPYHSPDPIPSGSLGASRVQTRRFATAATIPRGTITRPTFTVTIIVKPGDTTSGIARRYNVTVAELLLANPGMRRVLVQGRPVFARLRAGLAIHAPAILARRAFRLRTARAFYGTVGDVGDPCGYNGSGEMTEDDTCAGADPEPDDGDEGSGGGGGDDSEGADDGSGDDSQGTDDGSGGGGGDDSETCNEGFAGSPCRFIDSGAECNLGDGDGHFNDLGGCDVDATSGSVIECTEGFALNAAGDDCDFDLEGEECDGGAGNWDNFGNCDPKNTLGNCSSPLVPLNANPSNGQCVTPNDACDYAVLGNGAADGHYDISGVCIENAPNKIYCPPGQVNEEGDTNHETPCVVIGMPCDEEYPTAKYNYAGYCMEAEVLENMDGECAVGSVHKYGDPAQECVAIGSACDDTDKGSFWGIAGACQPSASATCPEGYVLVGENDPLNCKPIGSQCPGGGTYDENGNCITPTSSGDCPAGDVHLNSIAFSPCVTPGTECVLPGGKIGTYDEEGYCIDLDGGCGQNEYLVGNECLCMWYADRNATSGKCELRSVASLLCDDGSIPNLITGQCTDSSVPRVICYPSGTPKPPDGPCPSCPVGQAYGPTGTCMPVKSPTEFCPSGSPKVVGVPCPTVALCPGGGTRDENDNCLPPKCPSGYSWNGKICAGGNLPVAQKKCVDGLPANADGSCTRGNLPGAQKKCEDGLPANADGTCTRDQPLNVTDEPAKASIWPWIIGGAALVAGGAIIMSSQKGAKGTKGTKGTTGTKGTKGTKGAAGKTGRKGKPGPPAAKKLAGHASPWRTSTKPRPPRMGYPALRGEPPGHLATPRDALEALRPQLLGHSCPVAYDPRSDRAALPHHHLR